MGWFSFMNIGPAPPRPVRGIMLDSALDYIMRFVGTFYKWGGDDPSGFDCSGLVVEFCKSVGIMKRGTDATAKNLFEQVLREKRFSRPTPGGLVFYRSATGTGVCHVEITITNRLQLGASGGGSSTLDIEDAIDNNAYIKVRPIGSNHGLKVVGYVRLFGPGGNVL